NHQTEFIFMGDFNTITYDKAGPELEKGKKSEKSLPIVKWFERQGSMGLKEAKVEDMTVYTRSNHNSPVAEIKLEHLTSNYSKAAAKKK
ncbi:2373_t:CDS:2, partial [Gigaspora rosea]